MLISAEDECRSILTILLMKNKIFERHILNRETTAQRVTSIRNLMQFTQAAINRINVLYEYLPNGELKIKIPLSMPVMQMNVNMMNSNLKRFEDGDFF